MRARISSTHRQPAARQQRSRRPLPCLILCLALVTPAPAAVAWRDTAEPVRFATRADGRIDLTARGVPLRTVLAELQEQAGLRVLLDPDVALRPVSLDLTGVEPSDLLLQLLDPLGYVAEWETLPTGTAQAGTMAPAIRSGTARLRALVVFRPGQQAAAVPLAPAREIVTIELLNGRRAPAIADELLVRLRPDLGAREAADWLRRHGLTVVSHQSGLRAMRVRVGPGQSLEDAARAIDESGLFDRVEPHFLAMPPEDGSPGGTLMPPSAGPGWVNPDAAAALSASSRNVQVAVLDSGLNPVDGLGDRVVGGYDFIELDDDPQDPLGHGTSMAAIVTDLYGEQEAQSGIRNQVSILPVRVLADDGYTDYWTLSQAIWNAADSSARILNLSLSGAAPSELLEQSVQYAFDQGKILVTSAGNEGSVEPTYPAAYPQAIGVAGMSPRGDTVASYSNYGEWVDVAFVGRGLIPGDEQRMISVGTSAAAARLSATLALALAQSPELTPAEVFQGLADAAQPVAGADGQPATRLGAVDGATLLQTLGSRARKRD